MGSQKVEIKYTKLFINNEFVDAVSKKTFPTLNPATGKKIADVAEGDKSCKEQLPIKQVVIVDYVPRWKGVHYCREMEMKLSTEADIDLAVAAAKKAFGRKAPWRTLDASARGRLISKLADLLERDGNEIASLETLNNGKPYPNAVGEIQGAVNLLRYYAGFADKIHGNTLPADGLNFALTRKEPIGVVGQIVPWNYPLFLTAMKLGPALSTGCTVVVKPAEQTPLTALFLAALIKEAGFPEGVVNVVPGYGPTAGAALALHDDVRKIAFTGSTEVGHKIMEASSKSNLKRVTLELGGKNPLVIFNDSNIDQAVEIAHIAAFTNQGQVCCSGSRVYVQSGIYDEFVKKSVVKTKTRKVGDPFEAGVEHGPQIDEPSLEKVLSYIEIGKQEGAKLVIGGKQIGKEGYFVEPTIFTDVTDDMKIAQEEIFGPVQSVLKFETLDEVIERANNTLYGLTAGVITNDINNALVFAQAVEAGSVWVNTYFPMSPQTPFGGYKKSGFGKDLGAEALEGYLETKTIVVSVPAKV